MSQIPPGWYPDIHGTTRWWDGSRWTEYVWAPPPAAPVQAHAPAPAHLPARALSGGIPVVERPTLPKSDGVALWMVLLVGAVVVAAIGTVAVVLLTSEPVAEESAAGATEPSAPAEESAIAEAAPDPAAARAAAEAPTDAETGAFCRASNLDEFYTMGDLQDYSDLERFQGGMVEVGTPADMPARARAGWEWMASVDEQMVSSSATRGEMLAFTRYYSSTCPWF